MSRRIHLSPVGAVQTECYTVLQQQHKRHLSNLLIGINASRNSQSKYHVRKVRCLLEGTQKEVDVGRILEDDFVKEIESAARQPGPADEGGLAPRAIRCFAFERILAGIVCATGVNDVLANLDGEAAVVHVG